MKTKLMRFITSFFESWREEKKVLANQLESIVEHTDITVVRSTNSSCCGTCKDRAG